MFEKEKKEFLGKKDKSPQGEIDKDIKELLDKINSLKDYFTTSSCSGRIVLLKGQTKKESEWLFKSHNPIEKLEIKEDCWFLQEPPIIHVCCRDINSAKNLLKLAQDSGFGKSGIISLDKIILEIKGAEKIETFLTKDLPEVYLELLKNKANEKLLKSKQKIKILLDKLK